MEDVAAEDSVLSAYRRPGGRQLAAQDHLGTGVLRQASPRELGCGRGKDIAPVKGRRRLLAAKGGIGDLVGDRRAGRHEGKDAVVGADEDLIAVENDDRLAIGADPRVDDTDMKGSSRKKRHRRGQAVGRSRDVVTRKIMTDIDDFRPGGASQEDAFHRADVAVGRPEIGSESHDGHRETLPEMRARVTAPPPLPPRLTVLCGPPYSAGAMNKVFENAEEALRDVGDGAVVLSGGFGLCGNPENAIAQLAAMGTRDLTIISNNCGTTDRGLGILLKNGQVKKMISSYVGENKIFAELFLSGQLEVELNPQGTLAERIRAGGAGIEAFYTPTGFGTQVAEGKETRKLGGVDCVMETALRGDFALIKAWKGDRWGNLVFRKTARNFNSIMAAAGRVTIAEVEELVDVGEIPADLIHTPSIFVQRIFQGKDYQKPIEQLTLRSRS